VLCWIVLWLCRNTRSHAPSTARSGAATSLLAEFSPSALPVLMGMPPEVSAFKSPPALPRQGLIWSCHQLACR